MGIIFFNFWSSVGLCTPDFAKAKDKGICFGPDQYFVQAYYGFRQN